MTAVINTVLIAIVCIIAVYRILHICAVVLKSSEVRLSLRPELNDPLRLVHTIFNTRNCHIVLRVHGDDRSVLYKERDLPQRRVKVI